MVKRCVVKFCDNPYEKGYSLHEFPSDPQRKRIWVKFVQVKRADFSSPTTKSQAVICSAHFTADCFDGGFMAAMGFKRKKTLKPGSVPTVQPTPTEDQLEMERKRRPSLVISQPVPKKSRVSKVMHKREIARILASSSTATDTANTFAEIDAEDSPEEGTSSGVLLNATVPRNLTSVGTQCTSTRPSYRSEYTQVIPNMVSQATQCDLLLPPPSPEAPLFTSTPIPSPAPPSPEEKAVDVSEYSPSEESVDEAKEESQTDISPVKSGPLQQCTLRTLEDEPKYLVFHTQLMELFDTCPVCAGPAAGRIGDVVGTLIAVHKQCHSCGYVRVWKSQPYISRMPAGNLLLSASILVTGSLPSQTLRVFKVLKMPTISRTTYNVHQTKHIIPAILSWWNQRQLDVIRDLGPLGDKLMLAGDGRCDSPGHCAKYGTFTVIEQQRNKVLDIQLVQSNEVKNSSWCELEGFKRCLAFIKQQGMSIDCLVTDRHRQMTAYIRDTLVKPGLMRVHYFDVWHVAKGLSKKIDALSRQRGCEDVGLWRQAINNHLYWVAATAPQDDSDTIIAMWSSGISHIQNVHQHPNPLFPECAHGPLDGDSQWLVPGTMGCEKLVDLLENKMLVNDITKLSPHHQTSSLEAFHSLIIRFAPKHTAFSYAGMKARISLASLHYNENSDRMQAVTRNGKPRFSLRFPKYKKGGYSIRQEKTAATYKYTQDILQFMLERISANPRVLQADAVADCNTPPPLAAGHERPDMQQAVNEYVARFRRQ